MGSSSARFTILTPMASSSCSLSFSRAAIQRTSATPPPGTIPSSTAARVACIASSTRAFFSFNSVSVAAPTLITATPPANFAKQLLQFLAIVVRGSVLDLRADLPDAPFDLAGFSAALDDRGVVLVDGDLLGATEVLELDVLKLDAEVFGDGLAAGQRSDVLEHGLATIAKAGGLDRPRTAASRGVCSPRESQGLPPRRLPR